MASRRGVVREPGENAASDSGRLKVLVSAYACQPGHGSEAGVGWNLPLHLAAQADVWVLTRQNNRRDIERAISIAPVRSLHFLYYDLPGWARWWKRGPRGVFLYYYLWQVGALGVARRAHRRHGFHLVHHATFVRYWTPTFMTYLNVPLVWGPVGGAEHPPKDLLRGFTARTRWRERVRMAARWIGERDPFVRRCARRCEVAIATTPDSGNRLRRLGARNIEVAPESGLTAMELSMLGSMSKPPGGTFVCMSLGRHLPVKGFDLALEAFAQAAVPNSRYILVGAGPETGRLKLLTQRLEISHQVLFTGQLSRSDALRALSDCHVVLHPSLHDSGGWTCIEAMAAGRPVICLNLGGPAQQVTPACGYVVDPDSRAVAVDQMASAIRQLATDVSTWEGMSREAVKRAKGYAWEQTACRHLNRYRDILSAASIRI